MSKKAAAQPKADKTNKKKYEVASPVDHDGERFEIGEPIELSDFDAAPLLEAKAIKALD